LWYLYLQDKAVKDEQQHTTSGVQYTVSDSHRGGKPRMVVVGGALLENGKG
jgi:hypothetical protein